MTPGAFEATVWHDQNEVNIAERIGAAGGEGADEDSSREQFGMRYGICA